ncbi:hypothetical protein [Streptomyces sp. NPDC094031]|uniref:hypothetical protein n=1 Tax=Streptomyces sp. NPDC094031 TaxID=3155307 RepID=UPI0033325E9D
MSDAEHTRRVDLSFGTVTFTRLSVEPNDKPWEAISRPWITAYEIEGPRIRGTVRITPEYDEPITAWNSETPNEYEWEFLPSGLYVGYGLAQWALCEGDLEVWGSRLAEGMHVRPKRDEKRDFSVRRKESGIGDYAAPAGVRDKTREMIWALIELHRDDTALVREKAVAYLRDQHDTRLYDVRHECKAVEEALRALQGRHAELQARTSEMEGWSFEKAIEEAAPSAAPK